MIAIAIAIVILLILVLWYVGRKNTVFDNIFFDNNGTTQPHKEVVREMASNAWLGNASSSYAWVAKKKLDDLRASVLKWCRANHHKVIITSGASEANNMLIRSMVDHHWRVKPTKGNGISAKPHIILSSIEHKTSIECAMLLSEEGRVDVSFVNPDIRGNINPKDVNAAINARTILISIMSANNEIGNLFPVQEIAAIAASKEIPFHTDAVQTFGKYQPNLKHPLSCLSMSFHKMHGPQGIGVLVLDNNLADQLESQIAGSQNFYLRGGTENIPAVAGALKAMQITLADRAKKNQKMLDMKRRIMMKLTKEFMLIDFDKFAKKTDEAGLALASKPVNYDVMRGHKPREPKGLVVLGPVDKFGMPDHTKTNPNTLLLSVINMRKGNSPYERFCNIKLKSDLAADNAIVSIGSACQTGEEGPSHVLENIKAPFIVRCGVVRISLGDYNTMAQVDSFCKKFVDTAWLQ
jgi:cysteine desulfurase